MSYFGTKDFIHEVAAGNVTGSTTVRIAGHSDSVGTNLRTLYHETNTADLDTDAQYDTPSTIKVASTADADNGGTATGALTVRVHGVNSSDALATEDFTLNGQTESAASTTSFKAVHKVEVLTVGSGGSNAGVIWVGTSGATFSSGVPDVKLGAIETGTNLSAICHYLVPTGKKLYIQHIDYQLGDTSKAMNAQLVTYNGTLIQEIYDLHTTKEFHSIDHTELGPIAAGTLIRINCNVDSTTAKINISMGCILVGHRRYGCL
jgi:hypothetical protein